MMKKNYYLICVLLLAAFCTTSIATAQNYFGDFPVKADPKTVGNKLSRRLMETKHQLYLIEEYIMLKYVHGTELSVLQN